MLKKKIILKQDQKEILIKKVLLEARNYMIYLVTPINELEKCKSKIHLIEGASKEITPKVTILMQFELPNFDKGVPRYDLKKEEHYQTLSLDTKNK